MKEYLENRITHLKNAEWEYFNKSVDVLISYAERDIYRRFSNEFAAARRECEMLLKKLNEGLVNEANRKVYVCSKCGKIDDSDLPIWCPPIGHM